MSNTIIYIGGKSGGHILPCLALARKEKTDNNTNIIFIAANTALDHAILQSDLNVKKNFFLPFYSIKKNPQNMFAFLYSIIVSLFIILRYKPKKIVSSGGALSLTTCLIGYISRTPIELYELNVIPGRAVHFLSRFATKIFVCFTQTKKYFPSKQTVITHYPVRYTQEDHISKERARSYLQLLPDKKTILIIGGSQGSQFLNKLMIQNQTIFNLSDIQIIHLVGNSDPDYFQKIYTDKDITHFVTTYTDQMPHLYCAADIVISRAGAGTLAELLFFKKETIIIPLTTTSTSHQIDNARAYAQEYPDLFCILEEEIIKNDYAIFFKMLQKKAVNQPDLLSSA